MMRYIAIDKFEGVNEKGLTYNEEFCVVLEKL
jgi:hypothetical protein